MASDDCALPGDGGASAMKTAWHFVQRIFRPKSDSSTPSRAPQSGHVSVSLTAASSCSMTVTK
jgi:hypothetical protein